MKMRLRLRSEAIRPELRWLSREVSLTVDGDLEAPFRVRGGHEIVVGPAGLASPAAAVLFRHALELALWCRLDPAPVDAAQLASALLVGRVAALYLRTLPEQEQSACLAVLPDGLAAAYGMLGAEEPVTDGDLPSAEAMLIARQLLPLQGRAAAEISLDQTTQRHAAQRLGELWALAAPAECLLASGGGERLSIDPQSGLNSLGCSPRPRRGAYEFGSTAAASISQQAYDEVEGLRQSLIMAGLRGRHDAALRTATEGIKRRLLQVCRVGGPAGIEVILTPSPADAQYAALHLARSKPAQRILNLVIAPEELGTGVIEAAQGLHCGALARRGDPVEPGTAVEGLDAERIALAAVAVRDPSGQPRPVAQIDAEVAHLVQQAAPAGQRCLLHLVDCTATGLRAPSLATVQALRARYDGALEVVVDAGQMRLGADRVRTYLEHGFMVLISGSSFAMGPPYSSALLVPAPFVQRAAEAGPLAVGLGAYWTRAGWPATWPQLAETLPDDHNVGLLLRWHAALWELGAYHAVPREQRIAIVQRLSDALREAIFGCSSLEPIASMAGDGDPAENLPTIFTFRLVRRHGRTVTPLDLEATRTVQHWLSRDVSDHLPTHVPDTARRIAAIACPIGRPVPIGCPRSGALQVAIGAHTISAVAFDPALGATWQHRLSTQVERALQVIKKIELLTKYYDDIRLRVAGQPRAVAAG